MTNPPFSKMRAFLGHAMEISDNVVFLAPLSHFTTRARIRDIRFAGFGLKRIITVPTPSDWPASGFQLAVVHLKRGWRGTSEISDLDALATRSPFDDQSRGAEVALVA